MSLSAKFRVHEKSSQVLPLDESQPKFIPDPDNPRKDIENPKYGLTTEFRLVRLVSNNKAGPHRGEVLLKNLSQEEYDSIADVGGDATVSVG